MKKPILTLLFIGGSIALFAQDTTSNGADTTKSGTDTTTNANQQSVNNMDPDLNSPNSATQNNTSTSDPSSTNDDGTTISSNRAYPAYAPATSIPGSVNSNFLKEYPNATGAQWEQSSDWWRVRYKMDGQEMNRYYGNRGESFAMALPVLQTYVPDDVVSKTKSMFGNSVYDIIQIKGAADSNSIYHVRVLENGQLRSEYIDAAGTAVTSEIFRTESEESTSDGMNQMNNNMGNWNTESNTDNNANSNSGTESSDINANSDESTNNVTDDQGSQLNNSGNTDESSSNTNATDDSNAADINATDTDVNSSTTAPEQTENSSDANQATTDDTTTDATDSSNAANADASEMNRSDSDKKKEKLKSGKHDKHTNKSTDTNSPQQ